MADVNRFSEGLIDAAERFADIVDSAQGRGARKGGHSARWLLLPVAGASAYALATSSSAAARKTRGFLSRAKDRATELPDADLLERVKEATGVAEQSRSTSGGRTPSTNGRKGRSRSQTQRRRKATPTR